MTLTHDIDLDSHIEKLHVQLRDVQSVLESIVKMNTLEELIPIWKRPGWTTPAEYFFVSRALQQVHDAALGIQEDIQHLVKGSDLVGGR